MPRECEDSEQYNLIKNVYFQFNSLVKIKECRGFVSCILYLDFDIYFYLKLCFKIVFDKVTGLFC